MRVIRHATELDLPAIVAIYNSTIASRMVTADLEPVTISDRLDWFNAHQPDRRPLWVMEHQQQILGWLGLQSFYGRSAYHRTVELSVYVAPEYRRQGVGQALLDHAIAHSPGLGIQTLLGIVFAENQPSVLLLRRSGFESWGYLPEVAEFGHEHRSVLILGKKV